MNQTEIDQLAALLTQFIAHAANTPTRASLYGKRMDLALAGDLRSALIAYGADYRTVTQARTSEVNHAIFKT